MARRKRTRATRELVHVLLGEIPYLAEDIEARRGIVAARASGGGPSAAGGRE